MYKIAVLPGDGTGPEIVTVGEPTRENNPLCSLKARVRVPDEFGICTSQTECVDDVVLAVRAREHDDRNGHGVCSIVYCSMTGFASNRWHIASTSSRAFASSSASIETVMTRPKLTCCTDEKPRSFSAFCVVAPSGSERPGLRATVTVKVWVTALPSL